MAFYIAPPKVRRKTLADAVGRPEGKRRCLNHATSRVLPSETSQGIPTTSDAFSDDARTIDAQILAALRDLQTTNRSVAFSELFEAFERCPDADSSHEEARPVSVESFMTARDFLYALPAAFPDPEVAATEAGDVSLDWFPGPGSTFTVLVAPGHKLIFATATPERRLRGVESFQGEVPSTILAELRRLF